MSELVNELHQLQQATDDDLEDVWQTVARKHEARVERLERALARERIVWAKHLIAVHEAENDRIRAQLRFAETLIEKVKTCASDVNGIRDPSHTKS
jgi:hypothetical protein